MLGADNAAIGKTITAAAPARSFAGIAMVLGPMFAESPDFWGLALLIGVTAAGLIVLSTVVADDRFAPAPAFCCYASVFFWWIATGLDNFVPDGKGPHTAAAVTAAITDKPLAAGTGAFGGLLSMSWRGRREHLLLARRRQPVRPGVRQLAGALGKVGAKPQHRAEYRRSGVAVFGSRRRAGCSSTMARKRA